MTNNNCTSETGAIYQGEIIKNDPEKLPYLKNRYRGQYMQGCEYFENSRNSDGRDHTLVYRELDNERWGRDFKGSGGVSVISLRWL